MTIKYIADISKNLDEYTDQINDFLYQLDTENEFYKLDKSYLLKSEFISIATINNEIIGISGYHKFHGVMRAYITIKNEFQGKGIAKKLDAIKFSNLKNKNYHILLFVISENNLKSINLSLSSGNKIAGKRNIQGTNMFFMFKTFDKIGKLLYFLIILTFPFWQPIDIIRNKLKASKKKFQ